MKSIIIKTLVPVCAALIIASLSACGEKSDGKESSAATTSAAETTAATGASTAAETSAAMGASTAAETTDAPETAAVTESHTPSSGGDIVGSWEYELGSFVYTFNADGTGVYDVAGQPMNFTYTADGSVLSITYEGSPAMELEYELDGDTLNIKDSLGNDTIYRKK